MRRFAGICMTVAVLALAVGCGKKGLTSESGGGGGGSGNTGSSESIEGTYLIIGAEAGGHDISEFVAKGKEEDRTIKITGDKMISMKAGKEDPVTYKLDASKNPKEIDMVGKKGPKGKEKDEKTYAIYKVDGDKLVICLVESEKAADRPKEFKTSEANKTMMMTLQKKK